MTYPLFEDPDLGTVAKVSRKEVYDCEECRKAPFTDDLLVAELCFNHQMPYSATWVTKLVIEDFSRSTVAGWDCPCGKHLNEDERVCWWCGGARR